MHRVGAKNGKGPPQGWGWGWEVEVGWGGGDAPAGRQQPCRGGSVIMNGTQQHHTENLCLRTNQLHCVSHTRHTVCVSHKCHTLCVCLTHVTHCVSCTAPLALVLVSAGVGGKTLLEASFLSHPTRPAGMGGLRPAGTGPARGHRCVLWLLANAFMKVTLTAIPFLTNSDLVAADCSIAIAVVATTLHLV
jgi:hypothetical protein